MIVTPLRLAIQPLSNVEAARFRREIVGPVSEVAAISRPEFGGDRAAVLQLGSRALRLARDASGEDELLGAFDPHEDEAEPSSERPESARLASSAAEEPSVEERRELERLRRRDREVRAHEQAHQNAGGQHAGGARLEYTVGPDGRRYAVNGSVSIDVSPVPGDPEATLRKMEIVQRAANAPANPSGADRQVAARATELATRARAELAAAKYERAEHLGARGTSPSTRAEDADAPPSTPRLDVSA